MTRAITLAAACCLTIVTAATAQSNRDSVRQFESGYIRNLSERSQPTAESRIIRATPIRGSDVTTTSTLKTTAVHDARVPAHDARATVNRSAASEQLRTIEQIRAEIARLDRLPSTPANTARIIHGVNSQSIFNNNGRYYGVDSCATRYDARLVTASGYGYYPTGVYNHPTVTTATIRPNFAYQPDLRTAYGHGYYPLGVYNHPTVFANRPVSSYNCAPRQPYVIYRSSGFGRHDLLHNGGIGSSFQLRGQYQSGNTSIRVGVGVR